MENEKLKKLSLKLVSNEQNYMESFRKNIDMYIAEKDITIREVAEVADISFDTLKTFIYGSAKDCKLSTAVKLARAFHVSIDELVGAGTVKPEARESMPLYRNLTPSDQYLVRWFVNYLTTIEHEVPREKSVSVMQLECNHHGNLKITSEYKKVDISEINEEYRHKIFFGITMPCENYMPTYSPYNILLIANDRKAHANENVLIRAGNNLFIVKMREANKETNFYSIRDGKLRLTDKDIDEIVGYVSNVIIDKEKR